jgi:phosphopantothenoylcysteine decarboxylase/phosphopantothenate--cysteine ligase
MRLNHKKILVGITAGIAAYKAAILVRILMKEGAEVKVVMTPDAKDFITPLTLSTLSQNPVHWDFFDKHNGQWNSHVELGMWADLMVIAPLTANTLAKMTHGLCDNLLLATYLSCKSQVLIAPAMDLDMWEHPAIQDNMNILRDFGHHCMEPQEGFLASGLHGKGRMAEPELIVDRIVEIIHNTSFPYPPNSLRTPSKPLTGKQVMVTAGPTYEKLDSVRFIGNFSSGKMGFALSEYCAELGAQVHLVSGPTALTPQHPHITLYPVVSTAEMAEQCFTLFPSMDWTLMAAAVADFTPAEVSGIKWKKQTSKNHPIAITLKPTIDILEHLGSLKKKHQLLLGFALEDHNEKAHAQQKIARKNLDYIVLNSLNDPGAGFAVDTNAVTLIDKHLHEVVFPLEHKNIIAQQIVNHLLQCV